MEIVNFDIKEFNELKDKKWMLGNNILYKMCSDYPGHTDSEEIRAKIWLIGRAYLLHQLKEERIKREINDNFYDKFIEEFVRFNDAIKFDEKLNFLKNKEFNKETLKKLLELHYELTKFFNDKTELSKRSCSQISALSCTYFPNI